jgi:Iap family predicted aminopeptidase
MTYKTANENLNHIHRVASASTREHANGRIDMIPPNAREPEEYYNTIRDQYFAMNASFVRNQERLRVLKEQLRHTLPHHDYLRVNAEYNNLASRQTKMQDDLSNLRLIVHAAGSQAFGTVFKEVAKLVLDYETFVKICREVETLLGRPEHEIKQRGGKANPTEHQRQRKKLQERRQQVRYAREIQRNKTFV